MYRNFQDRYSLAWGKMKPVDIPFIHAEGRKWITDSTRKPFPPRDVYRGSGVPKWMQDAIKKGLVKTNSQQVYMVTFNENNDLLDVVVSDDHTLFTKSTKNIRFLGWEKRCS